MLQSERKSHSNFGEGILEPKCVVTSTINDLCTPSLPKALCININVYIIPWQATGIKMVEFHRLKIIQIKESRWIIAISSNGSLYYTITCMYIYNAYACQDFRDLCTESVHNPFPLWSATYLIKNLGFRADDLRSNRRYWPVVSQKHCFLSRPKWDEKSTSKNPICLKVGIVQEFCLPVLPLDCYEGGVLWCFEMNDPKYNTRSSYKKHRNDLKWSQNIAKKSAK